MALASYSDLVTEIGTWLNRSDMSAEIPTFIRLFEARMNRRLRTPDQEQQSVVTLLTNIATYNVPNAIRQVKSIVASATGQAMSYSIDGTTFTIIPTPDGISNAPTVTVIGYSTLTPLDGVTTTSNWLLASHPDAYLYGALVEAAAFIRDDVHLPLWRAALDDVLEEVLREGNQRKVPMGPLKTMPAIWE
jgi:hypothetical protein